MLRKMAKNMNENKTNINWLIAIQSRPSENRGDNNAIIRYRY